MMRKEKCCFLQHFPCSLIIQNAFVRCQHKSCLWPEFKERRALFSILRLFMLRTFSPKNSPLAGGYFFSLPTWERAETLTTSAVSKATSKRSAIAATSVTSSSLPLKHRQTQLEYANKERAFFAHRPD